MTTRQQEDMMIAEMEDIGFDQQQDMQDEQAMTNQENMDGGIGVPEPEQQYGQHKFLAESLYHTSPEKVTFLDVYELGRPIFNMRFLLDIEDVCKYYLDELCKEYGNENKIAEYFRAKIQNIADSGMSKDGAIQMANVTKKVDVTRRRTRNIENLKGGGNVQQK